MNRIITLHPQQSDLSYFSCVVTPREFNLLCDLSVIGSFKRFDIDYEDDTKQEPTGVEKIYDIFLSKVFPNKKDEVLNYLNYND